MNKASSLSLLSNAVLVWNTLRISEIAAKPQSGAVRMLRSFWNRFRAMIWLAFNGPPSSTRKEYGHYAVSEESER
jgi:hypothetical protein